ncbi:MAG: hypothetical protein NTZ69_16065 [Bacteroidia bacterium]|nr:hypothetical protein [Bacteroidia bacterium]
MSLYVNGIDVFQTFGIILSEGSYASLICYPPLKPIEINVWGEENGIEADLSEPRIDTRQCALNFGAIGANADISGFIAILSIGSYHDFYFSELSKTYALRLVSQSQNREVDQLGIFTLVFADDNPLSGYTYTAPSSSLAPEQMYDIDEFNLAEYGIWALEGNEDDIKKSPAVRMNLLVNSGSSKGATYDGVSVFFQEKDIELRCAMRAANLTEFWRNYQALLYNLTKPSERLLYVDSICEEIPFFYKSANVDTLIVRNEVWCVFTLSLTIIAFVLGETEYILATESGIMIITEDGLNSIDLNKNVA